MATQKKRGPVHRFSGADASTTEEVFKVAQFLVVPEDQTQPKVFETLMPYLYVMRNNECSWAQITKLLKECGFKLQTSAVRSYYDKLLLTCLDICQQHMHEHTLLMAEIRKKTEGADLSAIAGIVSAIMDKQRTLVAPKVGSVTGLHVEEKPPVALSAAVRREATAAIEQCTAVSPSLEKKTYAEAPLRCLPLQEGVKPLPARNAIAVTFRHNGTGSFRRNGAT